MRNVDKKEIFFFEDLINEAKKSTCKKSKCGSLITKEDEIIGRGYNSPPKNLESGRRCENKKEDYDKKVTDKTCCIHAEQRAIINALLKNPDKLKDSILFFIRLDENENSKSSGNPYCTICSKFALEVGIKEFVLFHKKGPVAYKTEE